MKYSFFGLHRFESGCLEFGEWLDYDTSLKRLAKRAFFNGIFPSEKNHLYVMWDMDNRYICERYYSNFPKLGYKPCAFLEKTPKKVTPASTNKQYVIEGYSPSKIGGAFDFHMIEKALNDMSTQRYHISYTTEKERIGLIQEIQFKKDVECVLKNYTRADRSLYNLFGWTKDIQGEDAFRFMVLIHNITFETIDIIDNTVVKSVGTYTYSDLEKRYDDIFRGLPK